MTVEDLKEYLQEFDDHEKIGFLCMDFEKEQLRVVKNYDFVKKDECVGPIVVIETSQAIPFKNIRKEGGVNKNE